MSAEDSEALRRQVLEVGERALRFEEYVLRRAWGIYYAVWALAFIAFINIPYIVVAVSPNYAESSYLFFSGYALVSAFPSWAMYTTFAKAGRTIRLRRALRGVSSVRYSRLWVVVVLIFLWFANLAIFFVPYLYFGTRGLSFGELVVLYVPVWLYYSLKGSFRKFPLEGLLAIASFACASVLDAYSLFTQRYFLGDVAWATAAGVWLFCSLYALYRAPEMLAVGEE